VPSPLAMLRCYGFVWAINDARTALKSRSLGRERSWDLRCRIRKKAGGNVAYRLNVM
jgi:hypothetical protein